MKKRKFDHKLDQTDEIKKIQEKVRGHIRLAQYKTAFKYLTKMQKKYPQSYFIASLLATLNAEDAWVLPEKQKDKAFDIAAKKLKVLLKYSRGATVGLRKRNYNEYYWFAQFHKKQYDFGKKRVLNGEIHGLYSQGVGAANYAYKLMREGKKTLGLKWAQKSVEAWDEYFKKVSKDYHDPYYWYALALGLQDKDFSKALNHSAKLAKKNVKTNPAYKKIRLMILEVRKK